MEDLIGTVMEKSLHRLLEKDEIYWKDRKELRILEEKYQNLALEDKQRCIIDDYVACLQTAESRISEISYVAGIRDTLQLLNRLELLK